MAQFAVLPDSDIKRMTVFSHLKISSDLVMWYNCRDHNTAWSATKHVKLTRALMSLHAQCLCVVAHDDIPSCTTHLQVCVQWISCRQFQCPNSQHSCAACIIC